MSLLRRLLQRPVSQFPERQVKRVLRESSALGGLAGQLGQGFENGIHLDFANDFHYVKVAGQDPSILPFTSLFTFTGDNRSMYRGFNGLLRASQTNVPRIEFDANGRCLGLLVEGARTNLCLQSQDFTTTWTTSAAGTNATITTNTLAAPDGTTTADSLIEDTDTGFHYTFQNITKAASSLTYSATVFAKVLANRGIRIVMADGSAANGAQVNFSLSGNEFQAQTPGTFGTGFTAGTASVTAFANGWYRLQFNATTNTDTTVQLQFNLISGTSGSYAGDGASGAYLWGAQLEQASFPSSYIPTTTASVTRASEGVIDANLLSGFNGATNATLYSEVRRSEFSSTNYIWQLLDGSSNHVGQYMISSTGRVTGNATSNTYDNNAGVNSVVDIFQKGATAFKSDDSISAQNGTTGGADATVTLPGALTKIYIGSRSGGNFLFGHIRRLDYWPERKPNSELQRLTS